MKNTLKKLRTFKHIQWNYHTLILDSHNGNINKELEKWIIPSCKIYMVEEGILDGGPKSGEKEDLGEGEWVSLNTLSLRKIKIWQDYSTLLELQRGEKRGFFCLLEWRRGGVYIVVMEKIWMKYLLMRVDKGSKRIINLDLILEFGEIWYIKCRDWWEWGASKIRFSCSYCNSLWSQIQKVISYLILIVIALFLCSHWSLGCLVSRKINLIYRFNIFWEISMKWWEEVIC